MTFLELGLEQQHGPHQGLPFAVSRVICPFSMAQGTDLVPKWYIGSVDLL